MLLRKLANAVLFVAISAVCLASTSQVAYAEKGKHHEHVGEWHGPAHDHANELRSTVVANSRVPSRSLKYAALLQGPPDEECLGCPGHSCRGYWTHKWGCYIFSSRCPRHPNENCRWDEFEVPPVVRGARQPCSAAAAAAEHGCCLSAWTPDALLRTAFAARTQFSMDAYRRDHRA